MTENMAQKMLNPEMILAVSAGLLLLGALISALLSPYRKVVGWVAFVFVLVASSGITYAAIKVFAEGARIVPPIFTLPAIGAGLTVRIDALSAVFVLIFALVGICATLYSVRYIQIYDHEHPIRYYPFLLLFLASLIWVVTASDMLFFIVAWELMTLFSYALVVYEKEDRKVIRAGIRYFIATHIATACMLLAAVILYVNSPDRSFAFSSLRAALENMAADKPGLVHLVLFLFFVGFATKAGILPFGFWLPEAHPAAPSSFSALLSGIMIKTGVYGVIRVFGEILPLSHFSTNWGIIISLFGTISLFIGVVTALVQTDSKVLLAFSSIENIGYIFLAVGMGIAFLRITPAIAVASIVAGLFHLVNHACFKSLLFLNAGSVLYRSGTRDMGKVSGLINIMPLTGFTAIIGSLSISGIPPFNGFSSKWLIFSDSLMAGRAMPIFLVMGVIAVFVSAVTIAVYLKFLGTIFLGQLYSDRELEHKDVPVSMRIPQVVIALFCILFGVVPTLPISLLHQAAEAVLPEGYAPPLDYIFGTLPAGVTLNLGEGIVGAWNPLPIVLAGVLTLLLSYAIYRSMAAPVRKTSVWQCGVVVGVNEARFKAHGYYVSFRDFLAFRIGRRWVRTYFPSIPVPKAGWLAKVPVTFDVDRLYYKVVEVGKRWCEKFSETHIGVPQVYVLWMVAGMVLAIVILYALS